MPVEFDKLLKLLERFDAKGYIYLDINKEVFEVVTEINGIPFIEYEDYINELYNKLFAKIHSSIDKTTLDNIEQKKKDLIDMRNRVQDRTILITEGKVTARTYENKILSHKFFRLLVTMPNGSEAMGSEVFMDGRLQETLQLYTKILNDITNDLNSFIHIIDNTFKNLTSEGISKRIISDESNKSLKSFIYLGLVTDPNRLEQLYNCLVKKGFVSSDEKIIYFKNIFSGISAAKPIIWSGTKGELVFFVRTLEKYKVIKEEPKVKWKITAKYFLDPNGCEYEWRSLKGQDLPSNSRQQELIKCIILLKKNSTL